MTNLKIGITVSIKSSEDSIWTNGIKLNTLILSMLLKKSSQNYQSIMSHSQNLTRSLSKKTFFSNLS